MPTTRKRRSHRRREPASQTALAILHDEPFPPGGNVWEDFSLRYNHGGLGDELWQGGCAAELWAQYGDETTRDWIRKHPGTRPSLWWRFAAPRLTDQRHGRHHWPLIEARLHVGGGRTLTDGFSCGRYGVPEFHYQVRPPRKPTMIESQAAYLDRHGLLAADEHRRIPATAFDPVPL